MRRARTGHAWGHNGPLLAHKTDPKDCSCQAGFKDHWEPWVRSTPAEERRERIEDFVAIMAATVVIIAAVYGLFLLWSAMGGAGPWDWKGPM